MTGFDPISFLEDAVRTPSHEEVGPMRELLVETLAEHGHDPAVDDAGNVLVTRGAGRPHVVLNTHVDTVPPHVPFERDGDVIRGRGSCDAKGPLAALLAAFLAVDPTEGRMTLAVTPDEETLSTNAHAASPEEGVNAVRALAPAIDALDSFDDDEPHPALGPATLTPTTVEGGTATNQVPASASFVVDRRSVPPEGAEEFRTRLVAHLRAAAPDDVGVSVTLTD